MDYSIRALSLRARLDSDIGLGAEHDAAAAADRLRWWQSAYFHDQEELFEEWFRNSGAIALEDVVRVVERESPATLDEQDQRWVDCLEQALGAKEFLDLEGAADARRRLAVSVGLNCVSFPFVRWAAARFERKVQAVANDSIRFTSTVVDQFANHVRDTLARWALPSAGLLVNIARVEGGLSGESPEARATCFADRLLVASLRPLIVSRLPVLDRMLAEITANTVEAAEELLERLVLDQDRLRSTFSISEREVSQIRFGLGDPHQRGRTVAIVSFGEQNVVYKPRSLSTDVAFYGLLDWLEGKVEFPPPSLLVVDREEYGWAEFIEYGECRSLADVKVAYRRTGILIAALHLCGGSDIHHENLIYRGDALGSLLMPRSAHRNAAPSSATSSSTAYASSPKRLPNCRSSLRVWFILGPHEPPVDAHRPVPAQAHKNARLGSHLLRIDRTGEIGDFGVDAAQLLFGLVFLHRTGIVGLQQGLSHFGKSVEA
ncbi:MAG: DUF4135 domain-containing protein [Caulobacter sp.]|nr:DUF4135 domain-containing protein [Caulobacter sp.]